jgi:hypothetical protein
MKLAPQDEITEAGMPRLRLVLEILRVQTLQKLLQLVLIHILVQRNRFRLVEDLFPDADGSACSEGNRNGVTRAVSTRKLAGVVVRKNCLPVGFMELGLALYGLLPPPRCKTCQARTWEKICC